MALDAYQWPPSTEALAARVGLDPRAILRFDGNVPPTPPASARPATLARALADVNEYDRGRYESLRQAIAGRHGVGLDQISLGAGSDEFIVLVARIFAEGGTVATVPAFSYSMYRYAALMAGATVIDDPAKADLVFVCRPNNPTGELPEIPDVTVTRLDTMMRRLPNTAARVWDIFKWEDQLEKSPRMNFFNNKNQPAGGPDLQALIASAVAAALAAERAATAQKGKGA